ncbi:putative proline-rich receptor-like protein kinase PERK3 [Iris pallida]|uniref:Proline-rich receptor-like protein kinase PERK3 n=1 Tax=Iris pallida TaxID=29817 RepID=A0AAX6GCK6_IRIPA|nr:putative proline-rich receptor-like protein kinase PERK3 [Iris pallida]
MRARRGAGDALSWGRGGPLRSTPSKERGAGDRMVVRRWFERIRSFGEATVRRERGGVGGSCGGGSSCTGQGGRVIRWRWGEAEREVGGSPRWRDVDVGCWRCRDLAAAALAVG